MIRNSNVQNKYWNFFLLEIMCPQENRVSEAIIYGKWSEFWYLWDTKVLVRDGQKYRHLPSSCTSRRTQTRRRLERVREEICLSVKFLISTPSIWITSNQWKYIQMGNGYVESSLGFFHCWIELLEIDIHV